MTDNSHVILNRQNEDTKKQMQSWLRQGSEGEIVKEENAFLTPAC